VRAGQTNCAASAPALEKLCRAYWYPLYAFVRRRGADPQEAEDLTQEFFSHLFECNALKHLDEEKGKFRSFLLSALSNFLINEWDKRCAQKRGGKCEIISWDQLNAEARYSHEPAHHLTPDRLFERRWAIVLLDHALQRLDSEYAAAGKQQVYDALRDALTAETSAGFYSQKAAELRMPEGSVRVALHRLRRRFGELLRSEIAYTVADAGEIEDEIRHLLKAIAE